MGARHVTLLKVRGEGVGEGVGVIGQHGMSHSWKCEGRKEGWEGGF